MIGKPFEIPKKKDIKDLKADNVWHNDSVEQVWGLGVPALRLPFYAVAHLFEAWMPSYAPQMVLLTFVVTKVRPAAGNCKTILRCLSNQYFRDTYVNHPRY